MLAGADSGCASGCGGGAGPGAGPVLLGMNRARQRGNDGGGHFAIGRITYALPFQATRRTETDQVDKLIRIACKAALGLPASTSTERLRELGLTNTYEELAAATMIAQRERLNATPQGRCLLRRLHYPLAPQFCGDETQLIPLALRKRLHVYPIPRNMHPTYHARRRRARATALLQRQGHPDTYFADASLYPPPPPPPHTHTHTQHEPPPSWAR
ncbi:hypothetical protein HPB49_016919 [Dermacentor silvarum]|uniref:Uncharacterized protein n=1 Tax=Dermacentor silvarum TaxID=543639 RepID=A0ACB8DJT3_DERSI|nr:hypothetical protein HPB49_016919 [Dermacentor silvarum]